MIAGAFSSTSGKADITMTTNGDMLYYNSGRQRLAKGDDGEFLKLASGLPSWAAGAGSTLELLDVHTATGTESTYTFTEDLDFADYSNFIVIVQGGATAALALQALVNGSTSSNHHYTMEYSDGSSIADSYVQDATSWEISTTNMFAGGSGIFAYIEIYMNDVLNKYPFYRSYSRSYPQLRWERHLGVDTALSSGDITSITVKTSTSTWIAGTRICIYGFKTA